MRYGQSVILRPSFYSTLPIKAYLHRIVYLYVSTNVRNVLIKIQEGVNGKLLPNIKILGIST